MARGTLIDVFAILLQSGGELAMITKQRAAKPYRILVTFELPECIWAHSVYLVGEFNGWNPTSHPLVQNRRNPNWHITLELEANREYQFRYLLDGEKWVNDCDADRYVPDQYGGENSVVSTRLEEEETARDGALQEIWMAAPALLEPVPA